MHFVIPVAKVRRQHYRQSLTHINCCLAEETAIYNIQNNYDNSGPNTGPNYECTINPLDKVFELVDEIRKLYAEKEALYERLLKSNKKD
jgi:hypothetical protein